MLTALKADENAPDVANTAKQEPTEGARKAKEAAEANVSEETKSRTSEMAEKAKNYLSEKVPPQRRDQAIARLKRMVVEIQSHPDCKFSR